MQRAFTHLLRQQLQLKLLVTRGPKKVKQEQVAQSDDLINIWKERKDPEIKDIDEYPVWLLELALPLETAMVHQISFATADKPFFPPRSHFRGIIRSVQREKIITLNEFDQITRKKPPTSDDLDNDADALEHIQQEKLDAEQAAQDAADAAEADEDDEDAPKARKPIIQKEVDDDDDKGKTAKPAAGAAAGKGGAAAGKTGAAAAGKGGAAGGQAKKK